MGECQQPSCPYTTVAGQKNHHQTCPSVILAPLAQLDRASGYEPEGREFESLRAHHSYQIVAADFPIAELGPLGPTVKESPALLAADLRYSSS